MVRDGWLVLGLLVCACANEDAPMREAPEHEDAGHASEVPDAGAAPAADVLCDAQPALRSGLVTVSAALEFEVDGTAFVPQGVNSYPLLQHVGLARLDALDDILMQAAALERPLLRIPAFLDVGSNPARLRNDDGTLREEGLAALDRVLAAAAERGVRLILMLTNNWEDFGGAPALVKLIAPGENLPKNAFWSDPRAHV